MKGSEQITEKVILQTTEALKKCVAEFHPQKSGWFLPPLSVTTDVMKLQLPDGIATLSVIIQYLEKDNA